MFSTLNIIKYTNYFSFIFYISFVLLFSTRKLIILLNENFLFCVSMIRLMVNYFESLFDERLPTVFSYFLLLFDYTKLDYVIVITKGLLPLVDFHFPSLLYYIDTFSFSVMGILLFNDWGEAN